jgi:NUMOD3 motif
MKFQKGHVAWNKGKRWKWSAESKKKLSQAKKGKSHPHKGAPHTEESRRKIGEANKGKPKPPRSPEHARKISEALRGPNNPNYGKRFSEETKQKMRAAHAHAHNGRRRKGRIPWNKNKRLSREHRKHISEARKGKPHPHT